jgi:hypothetical protein
MIFAIASISVKTYIVISLSISLHYTADTCDLLIFVLRARRCAKRLIILSTAKEIVGL